MKVFIFSLSIFILAFFSPPSDKHDSMLQSFYEASTNPKEIDKFLIRVRAIKEKDDPVSLAYRAMAYFLQAKQSWNPYHKYDYFLKGRELLQDAVSADPVNTEVRYLRLCTQSALPCVLNYSSDIKEDSQFLIQSYSSIKDEDLKLKIRQVLLDFRYCQPDDLIEA